MANVPRAEAPSRPLAVRLSPQEQDTLKRAAKANYQTVSQFARDAMVGAAADTLEDVTAPRR